MEFFNQAPLPQEEQDELYKKSINNQVRNDRVLAESQQNIEDQVFNMPGVNSQVGDYPQEVSLADHYKQQANGTRAAIEDISLMPDLDSLVANLLTDQVRVDPTKQITVSEERGDMPLMTGMSDEAGGAIDKYNIGQAATGVAKEQRPDTLMSEVGGMLKESGRELPSATELPKEEETTAPLPGVPSIAQGVQKQVEKKELMPEPADPMLQAGVPPTMINPKDIRTGDRTTLYKHFQQNWFDPRNQRKLPRHVRGLQPAGLPGFYLRQGAQPVDNTERRHYVERRRFLEVNQERLSKALDMLDSYKNESELIKDLVNPRSEKGQLLISYLENTFLDLSGPEGKNRGANFTAQEMQRMSRIAVTLNDWGELVKLNTIKGRLYEMGDLMSDIVTGSERTRGLVHSGFQPTLEDRQNFQIRFEQRSEKHRPKYYVKIKGPGGKPLSIPYSRFKNRLNPAQQKQIALPKTKMKSIFKEAKEYFNK